MDNVWQWKHNGMTHLMREYGTVRGVRWETICGTWHDVIDPDDYPLAPGLVDRWCLRCQKTEIWRDLYLTPVEEIIGSRLSV